jgi:hypothetical protein
MAEIVLISPASTFQPGEEEEEQNLTFLCSTFIVQETSTSLKFSYF